MGTLVGAKKGREKGKRWERKFAEELSLWWSEGEDKNIFRRAFGSRKTVEADSQGRDIMAVKKEGFLLTKYFDFELKHVEKVDLWDELVNGVKGLVFNWLSGMDESKENVLVLKRNRKVPLLCCSRSFFVKLKDYGDMDFESCFVWRLKGKGIFKRLMLVSWDEWRRIVDPKSFQLFLRGKWKSDSFN